MSSQTSKIRINQFKLKIIRLVLFYQLKEEENKKKTLLCLPFDSTSTGLFKMKAFFSVSKILRSLRSYLTYNSGSSGLELHLQCAQGSNE